VAHSRSPVEVGTPEEIDLKAYKKDIPKYVMMPGNAKKRRTELLKRLKTLENYCENSPLHRREMKDTRVGIISAGGAYLTAREAAPGASFLKLGMVYPLPEGILQDFAKEVEKVFVVEELEPYLEEHIKALGIEVLGREVFPEEGEYAYHILAQRLGESGVDPKLLNLSFEDSLSIADEEIPLRPPVLCPGCPHRGTFYTLKNLAATVTGDIGCYTLGALPPLSSMETCICMGASIGNALGMEKARGRDFARKVVAVIGDSTFIHSGITGLIDVVYNQGTTTVIILDNSTTGMTGHQDHPATGKTLRGDIAPVVDIPALVKSIGAQHVRVVDPFDLKALEQALKEETSRDALSVIITRRPCVLLDKKYTHPAYAINDKCKKCGVCMKLGCPAIAKKDGEMRIDATVCTGCGLCPEVCKFGAIEKAGDVK
jgi:indolepyruvate ferredoxin oxidoreductase alpha subunit